MVAWAALAVGGCSNSPYELAHVTGTVKIDGQPFTEGKLMFAPIAKGADRKAGRAAFGKLADDGSYALGTYEDDDGAVVGEHWVTLIHIKAESSTAARQPAGQSFSQVGVPKKVTVVAGEDNKIDINLTRQDVAKYGMFDD